jgi:hypothetical protein
MPIFIFISMPISIPIVGSRKGSGIRVAPPLAVAPIDSAGQPAVPRLVSLLFAVARDGLKPMPFPVPDRTLA